LISIYCAAGDTRYYPVAEPHGILYGARMPEKVYRTPFFVDNDWNHPDRSTYMKSLALRRPVMATVLDWEYAHQEEEVFSWLDEAADHVQRSLIIIPKLFDLRRDTDRLEAALRRIPRFVKGREVVWGYPVPLRSKNEFAGDPLPDWYYENQKVHLLGGSPHKQYELSVTLGTVVSVDNSYMQARSKMLQFLSAGGSYKGALNKRFPQLQESVYGDKTDRDLHLYAFKMSCMNFVAMWTGYKETIRFAVENDIEAMNRIARMHPKDLPFISKVQMRESLLKSEMIVSENCDGVVTGFARYHTRRDGVTRLYDIAVHRDYRKQLIGTGLIAALPKPLEVVTPFDSDANAWYERLGYRLVKRYPGKSRDLHLWSSE
jgi:N-acetylglutamate synthase-like GNAT family acetyltransferase